MTSTHSRPWRRALIAGLAAGAMTLGMAPAAMAAPGDWTQLSAFPSTTAKPKMSIIDIPTVARFGSALQVVWNGEGTSGENYYTAIVDGAGAVTTPSREIISNWSTVTENAALMSLGGQRFLAFSGLQSTTTGAPYTSGAEYYATSPDGQTFTLGAGTLSHTTTAYGAYGNDIVDNAGTPVWVGNAGTTNGVSWHSGISPTDPAPDGSDGHFGLTGCCAYNAAGARDPATGAVYAAFYSNSSGSAEQGVQVGQILPTQGAFTQAPGSITTNDYGTNSVAPTQRIALVGRPGGGIYAAYTMGYPSVTSIRVWHVGTGDTMDVPAPQSSAVSLSADPSGRLWLTFAQGDRIKVVHTNKAATAFGAMGTWGAPRGTVDLWKTATAATDGTLDIVATASDKTEKVNVWHTQAVRTLSIKGSPNPVRRGADVTFTVTDAGDPVSGVSVKFGGRTATTNGAGKATIVAPGSRGKAGASAKKAGFNEGKAVLRVR